MASRYTQKADRNFRRSITAYDRYRERGVQQYPGAARAEVSLSVSVMAHSKRAAWVPELVERVGGANVVWDQKNDRHDTGLRAILDYDPKATHHLVIQDDAVVPDDFREGLVRALRYADPESPVGLYYGGKGSSNSAHVKAWLDAESRGASWLVRKGPIWGPGIVYPVSSIPDLNRFYKESSVQNYDRRVMRFYQSRGKLCWYSMPSLVDHRLEGNPSLVGHDSRGERRARSFIGPRSALDVDWSGPVVVSRNL
jgi:hypothetical protein